MTMQIGMVGTDGVLIASDTQWTDNEAPVRSSTNSTKFVIDDDCSVAVARAGSMHSAGNLAFEIIALTLQDENWRFTDFRALSRIGERVLASARPGREAAQCLVAFTRPTPALWLFEMARMGDGWGLVNQEVLSKKIAGDTKNAATFWAERYYRPLPIKTLVPLAAHLIVSAHTLNTAGIGGLEIVLCDAAGIRRVPDDVLRTLEIGAAERDQSIGESLLIGKTRDRVD
jgi:hypothetical protein